MSVLERSSHDGRDIEVRGAGRTRRLYVDGVLHTSWSPARPLTGAVWDHLALPAFFVDPKGAERVVILGVGGGAVLHLLRDLCDPKRLVGVELDGELLRLARRWFALEDTGADIVHGDARAWLRANARSRFDLVIDDLFIADDGEPARPPGLDGEWWTRLAKLVAPGGVLVANFTLEEDLIASPLCQDVSFRERFPTAYRFEDPFYENSAVALLSESVSLRAFRARLAAHAVLGRAPAQRLMRFRVRKLWPR